MIKQDDMTIEKWIELLKVAGITKDICDRDEFVVAHMHGPTIMGQEVSSDLTPPGKKYVLFMPPGWDAWDGDKEWREIEAGLD